MTQPKHVPQRLVAAAVLTGVSLVAGVSRTPAQRPGAATSESSGIKRTVRVLAPRSMPPETTLFFKAIRNVESPNWLRELNIEVQNNFSKPIFFLSLHLSFPDLPQLQVEGVLRSQVISLTYGRWHLMRRDEFATSADLPIKSGEAHVFHIPESDREAFEEAIGEMGVTESEISKIEITMYLLSFGNGTGFRMGARFP